MTTDGNRERMIVRLSGGLGNQMFQVAFGMALSGGRRLGFDTSGLASDAKRTLAIDCFETPLDLMRLPPLVRALDSIPGMWRWTRPLGRTLSFPGGTVVWDGMEGHDERLSRVEGNLYAIGYWQDERYFRHLSEEVRNRFAFNGAVTPETADLLASCPGSVGVQVRRGDYLDPAVARIHPAPDRGFYERAVREVVRRTGVRRAIVATDDPDWVRRELHLPVDECIVRSLDAPAWEDMMILSRCDHVVISNSSFGWWAAWLGDDGRSVTCPEKWYGPDCGPFRSPALPGWVTL